MLCAAKLSNTKLDMAKLVELARAKKKELQGENIRTTAGTGTDTWWRSRCSFYLLGILIGRLASGPRVPLGEHLCLGSTGIEYNSCVIISQQKAVGSQYNILSTAFFVSLKGMDFFGLLTQFIRKPDDLFNSHNLIFNEKFNITFVVENCFILLINKY